MSDDWIEVCATGDVDEEDVIRFDHGENTFCIYNTSKGFYATDGQFAYYHSHKFDIDVKSFNALNLYYAKDAHNVYYEGDIVIGVDPASFKTVAHRFKAKGKDTLHCYTQVT